MRRALVLVLVLFLAVDSASAGVDSHQAKVSGASTRELPVGSQGFLVATDKDNLNFYYKAGRNKEIGSFPPATFELPYEKINRFVYSETKHLRVGETIALAAVAGAGGLLLLLSKSHAHYLTIDYIDSTNTKQTITFEVGKEAIGPLIDALEIRTGKKVELDAGPVAPTNGKP